MYMLSQTEVKFMENHMFTTEIKDLKRELDNINDMLVNLHIEISEYFGDAAQCTSSCETVMDHLEKTINSLALLDRRIPRSYTPESRDRDTSKLESRIKRLERLMK